MSRQVVFDMMSVQPDVTLQLAMSVISNISSYVRSIDFALDWVLIESGQVIFASQISLLSIYTLLSLVNSLNTLFSLVRRCTDRARRLTAPTWCSAGA